MYYDHKTQLNPGGPSHKTVKLPFEQHADYTATSVAQISITIHNDIPDFR